MPFPNRRSKWPLRIMLGDIFVEWIFKNSALFAIEIEMVRSALGTSTIRKIDNDCTSGTCKCNNQKPNFLYYNITQKSNLQKNFNLFNFT